MYDAAPLRPIEISLVENGTAIDSAACPNAVRRTMSARRLGRKEWRPVPALDGSAPGLRILLIESSSAVQRQIQDMLSAAVSACRPPCTVELASTLSAGLALQRYRPVDVVLLDLELPDSMGLATAVRFLALAPAHPVVVLADGHDPLVAREVLRAGAQDYLTKTDLGPDSLLRTLDHAIERHGFLARQLAARQQAEAAMMERDRVLETIAHDLASPASAILATTQILQRGNSETAPDGPVLRAADRRECLRIIGSAAEALATQVTELLDVARVRAGERIPLRLGRVDLGAVVADVVAGQQVRAGSQCVDLALTAARLYGMWDGPRLRRVVDNLVGNAVKYTPRGGTISVRLERARVERPRGRSGTMAVLTVQDPGIGIPAADLSRVFEPFQRASNVGAITGTGLGLASAREIVEQHGGTIEVTSEEGTGTTVTMQIPVATATRPRQPLRLGTRVSLGRLRTKREASHTEAASRIADSA